MSPPPPPFVRTPDANFAALEFPFAPHYLDVDGLRMHYIDEGPSDAPVALMLHGMPTWSYLYRHIIVEMSNAGYRCIAPDHIGFGRSDKVTDPSWYDIARHSANLAALVRSLDRPGTHSATPLTSSRTPTANASHRQSSTGSAHRRPARSHA